MLYPTYFFFYITCIAITMFCCLIIVHELGETITTGSFRIKENICFPNSGASSKKNCS